MQFESYRPRNRQGVGRIQQEGKMFQSDCQSRLRGLPCVGPSWLGCKTVLPFRDLSAPFSHFILLNYVHTKINQLFLNPSWSARPLCIFKNLATP